MVNERTVKEHLTCTPIVRIKLSAESPTLNLIASSPIVTSDRVPPSECNEQERSIMKNYPHLMFDGQSESCIMRGDMGIELEKNRKCKKF